MSDNRQWDSIQLETLNLPYNNVLRELDLTPRQVTGSLNTYVTYGGKIIKRPGTISIANTTLNSFRIDRLWIYETLDTPVIVYLMASVFNGTNWALYYNRLDGASPGWTTVGTLRHINVSTRPHEGTVSRGVFYAKGYPAAVQQEPLGTVLFNGTGGNPFTTFWGVVGPTTPARISGGVPRLNAAISASATTFNLNPQNNYNLLNWSQDLTQTSAWTANTIAVTSSNNAAPDGSNTADLVTSSGTNGYFYQPVTTVNGQTYIFSAWVKNSSNQNVQFAIYNGSGVGGTQLAASTFVAGNGWLRYFVTATATSTTTTVQIGGGNTLANTNTVQVWGAQFEINLVALTPSPYERTLGPYNLPAAPFNVQIDYELITVTAFNSSTGAITALRAAQGTVAAAHNVNAPVVYKDWVASTHPITVNNFWAYSYAYQTRSGHISNRSPLETNPDNNPSQTGPIINLVPKLQLYGTADTVNVPNLVVFRTTDGGGTWTQIATITNTGFNPISWYDQYLQSSNTTGSLVVSSFGFGGSTSASSVTAPYAIGGSVTAVPGTNYGNAAGFTFNANNIPTNPTWVASAATSVTASIASFKPQAGSNGISQVATTATASSATSATTAGINTTGATLLILTISGGAAIGTATVSDNQGNTWHALQNANALSQNSGIWYAYDKAGAPLATAASHTVTATLAFTAITFSAFQGTLPNHIDPLDYAAGQNVGVNSSNTTIAPGPINASIGSIDPIPDSALNFQLIAPTLTSNSPPPTVISTNTTLSTLSVAMTLTTTSMTVATTYAGVAITAPAVPFTVTVDNEIMTVTAINTGTGVATVSRGINGSTLQIHAIGANVIVTPIVGLDTPIPSTPIAGYASRLWMGIGNILFYSAQEEINIGIPEEAWPSGQLGNFYRLQFPIVNLIDTTNSLYIITTEAIYQLTGSNLETFFLQPILHNIGGAIGHPQAVTKYRESVVWLTSDLRIAILQGGSFRILSEPLGLDYVNLINNQGASIILRYWAALDKDWIVLCASCTTPTNNQVWVYDVEKSERTQQDFWSTPWSIQASAMASGRIREIEQARRLAFATYDGTNTFITRITDNSAEYVGYDAFPSVAKQTYDFKLKSNLWMVPPGDHVNLMRRPGLIPIVYGLILEETVFSTPSTDPQIFYYTNDLWTIPKAAAAAEYSVHDDQPIGYRTRIFPIQEKARRFAFEIDKLQTTELFELQDFSIIYNSDSGSGI